MASGGNPPGKAKMELSCRRELNFVKCCKILANVKNDKIALSCRRERKNARMASGGNPPGKAKMELSCKRELNFMKVGKKQVSMKNEGKIEKSALVQARAPKIGPCGPKSVQKWIQNWLRLGP